IGALSLYSVRAVLLHPRRRLSPLRLRLLPVRLDRAIHVDADNPRPASRHHDVHDWVAARLAPALRPLDEPPLREGERVVALRVVRASDEALATGGVDDPELALRALVARRDQALIPDRPRRRRAAHELTLPGVC